MKKIFSLAVVIVSIVLTAFLIIFVTQSTHKSGTVNYNTDPTFVVASSTSFTLTTTSQRLLATSTPTRRMAALITPTNCTAAQAVYVNFNADVPATISNGNAIVASTSLKLESYPGIPVVQGAVNGITAVGTCTVLVTEWRTQY